MSQTPRGVFLESGTQEVFVPFTTLSLEHVVIRPKRLDVVAVGNFLG